MLVFTSLASLQRIMQADLLTWCLAEQGLRPRTFLEVDPHKNYLLPTLQSVTFLVWCFVRGNLWYNTESQAPQRSSVLFQQDHSWPFEPLETVLFTCAPLQCVPNEISLSTFVMSPPM